MTEEREPWWYEQQERRQREEEARLAEADDVDAADMDLSLKEPLTRLGAYIDGVGWVSYEEDES